MKYKDIAQKYEVSLATVKSWKTRYKWQRSKVSKSTHTKSSKVCVQNDNSIQNKCELPANDLDFFVENEELTQKQQLFCIYYIQLFNATKAYQKAYQCDYNTAAVCGSRLLKKVKIVNEINMLKQNRLNRDLITIDDIFQRYIDIAMANIADYVEFKKGQIEIKDLNKTDASLIKKISVGKITSIELQDTMKALDWLTKHMGIATDEQRAKIELLKAQTDKLKETEKNEDEQVIIVNDIKE